MMAARSSGDWRADVVAEVRRWIGTPYRHQQSVKHVGCDCIGLVRGVWREIWDREPELPPAYSSDWADTTGEETLLNAASRHMMPVEIAAISPGDLLLFRWRPHLPAKHCGILVEPDRMVHAYQSAGAVCEGWLAPQWRKQVVAAFAFPPEGGR